MSYELALAALADPTRRRLYARLRRRPHAVGDLARALGVSQPAVSQHLRVLRRARLVSERREGTRHVISASPEGLTALRSYLDSLRDDLLAAHGGGQR